MQYLLALLAGSLFGIGLFLSGMTDTAKVQGFLDILGAWDPTLMFVMGGAIIPMFIAWQLTTGRKPLIGGEFPEQPDQEISRPLIIGSIFFGIGWGLAGLCPGPTLASVGFGGWQNLLFIAAMIGGMLLAPRVKSLL